MSKNLNSSWSNLPGCSQITLVAYPRMMGYRKVARIYPWGFTYPRPAESTIRTYHSSISFESINIPWSRTVLRCPLIRPWPRCRAFGRFPYTLSTHEFWRYRALGIIDTKIVLIKDYAFNAPQQDHSALSWNFADAWKTQSRSSIPNPGPLQTKIAIADSLPCLSKP